MLKVSVGRAKQIDQDGRQTQGVRVSEFQALEAFAAGRRTRPVIPTALLVLNGVEVRCEPRGHTY